MAKYTVEKALEDRKKRIKEEEYNARYREALKDPEGYANKNKPISVEDALKERKKRIEKEAPSIKSDIAERYNSVLEAFNSYAETSPRFGEKAEEDTYSIQKNNRQKIRSLISDIKGYKSIIGEKKADDMIKNLDSMKGVYDYAYEAAKVYTNFKSEEDYQDFMNPTSDVIPVGNGAMSPFRKGGLSPIGANSPGGIYSFDPMMKQTALGQLPFELNKNKDPLPTEDVKDENRLALYVYYTEKAREAASNGGSEEEIKAYRQQAEKARSKEGYQEIMSGWLNNDFELDDETVNARRAIYERKMAEIKRLEQTISYTPDGEEKENLIKRKEALEAETNIYTRNQKVLDDYYGLRNNADFGTASRLRQYNNPTKEELDKADLERISFDRDYGKIKDYIEYTDETNNEYVLDDGTRIKIPQQVEVKDKLGLFLSAPATMRETADINAYSSGNYTWSSIVSDGNNFHWDLLKKEEIDTYYYLFNTQGQQAAYDFLDSMQTTLGRRHLEEETKEYNDSSVLNKIILNLASVPSNVVGGIPASFGIIGAIANGKEINPYSPEFALVNSASNLRGNTAKDIEEATGGVAIPGIDFSFGDFYQSIMSGADSFVGAKMFGRGYTVIMGMNAASSEAKDLYDKGATKEQIVMGASAAGAAEMIFEYVSLDHFLKNMDTGTKSVKQLLKQVLSQAGVEASEEVFTEIANTLTNAWVMKSQSEWAKLKEDGGLKNAFIETCKNVINAGIGGFVSGGGMAAVGSTANLIHYNNYSRGVGTQINEQENVGALLDDAQTVIDNNGKNKAVKDLANVVAKANQKGKTDTVRGRKNVGKLFDLVTNAQTQDYDNAGRNTFKGAVENAIKDSDISNKAKAAEIITKARFEALSVNESRYFNSIGGKDILNEVMNADNEQGINAEASVKKASAYIKNAMTESLRVENRKGSGDILSRSTMTDVETKIDKGEIKVAETRTGEKEKAEKATKIKAIKSIEDGSMTLELSDGTTVDSKDAVYGSKDEGLVYETVQAMGVSAGVGNTVIKAFAKSKMSANAFMSNAILAYNYGVTNQESRLQDLVIPSEVRNTLFVVGRDSAVKNAEARLAETKKKTARGTPTHKVTYVNDIAKKKLNANQKATVAVAEFIAASSPLDVRVFESYRRGNKNYYNIDGVEKESLANGWFVEGSNIIYLDINAGNNYNGLGAFTLAHEVSHYIRGWNATEWQKMADVIVEIIDKQAKTGSDKTTFEQMLNDKLSKYEAKRRSENAEIKAGKLSAEDAVYSDKTDTELRDMAYEDVICDSLQSLFQDKETFVEFADSLKKKNKVLWNKFKQAIRKFLDKLDTALKGFAGEKAEDFAGEAVQNALAKERDQIRKLFVEAFEGANKNFEEANRRGNAISEQTEDIRYSVREIIGNGGKNYGVGVKLDSTLLANLSPEERIQMVKEYVKELGGKEFSAFDNDGNAVSVRIAESNRRFMNKNGKRVRVNNDLAGKYIGNEVKQEAISLVDELIVTSKNDSVKPAKYSHGWLDNNGKNAWQYWTTFIQDKENTVWKATLNIANTAYGEKVLYDINPIEMVEQSVKSDTVSTNDSIAQKSNTVNTIISEKSKNSTEKYSDRDYSYDNLVSKPDMKVTQIGTEAPSNRADIVFEAKRNASKIGKFNVKDGSVSVYVDDIGTDVILGTDGLKHGLRRSKNISTDINSLAILNAGEIIKHSVKINELIPKDKNATSSYVLIGCAENSSSRFIVRSIINTFDNSLSKMDVLYAVKVKESAAQPAPGSAAKAVSSVTDSKISITDLLEIVNRHYPDILPESVLKHFGYSERPSGDLAVSALYSFRDTKSGMANDKLSPYSEELAQFIEQKGDYIVDNFDKLKQVVNLAFDNPSVKATAYFGIINRETLSEIKESIPNLPKASKEILFKDGRDYSIATTLDSIRHIVDEKGLSRDDVIDYLDRLADTVVEFDTVSFDYYYDSYKNRIPGLLFKKSFEDGKLISFDIVSQKKRSLSLQAIYLESVDYEKKKSAETLLLQNSHSRTPEVGVGQTSDNRVAQFDDNVKGKIEKSLDSDRDITLSSRYLLANALESTARNEVERDWLGRYKADIEKYNAEQDKLTTLNAQIKELSFGKGKRDMAKLRQLRDEKIKTENRINIYDKRLLRIETAKPLQNVIEREKTRAKNKALQQGREALEAYKKTAAQKMREEVALRKEQCDVMRKDKRDALQKQRDEYRQKEETKRLRRDMTYYRDGIKKIREDFVQRLTRGSETNFVPKTLANNIIDICNAIDPTGRVYYKPGTSEVDIERTRAEYEFDKGDSRAVEKYNTAKAALLNLKNEYDKLQNDANYDLSSEYDEEFSSLISQLADNVGDTPLREMNLGQLENVYNILSDINFMMKTAARQIGTSENISNYEAGQEIIELMKEIKRLGLTTNKAEDFFRTYTLNPMRAVKEMSAFDENSRLVKLFNALNEGRRKADTFRMNVNKKLEAIRDKDRKAYNDAVEKEYDFGLTDIDGNEVHISKMQAMFAVLTARREAANADRSHLQTPVLFPSLDLEQKGKYEDAKDNGAKIMLDGNAVAKIMDGLSEWDKEYLAVAEKVFNEDCKDAVNATTMQIKHRPVALEASYVPYIVNQDYIAKESDNIKFDKSILNEGILKDVKKNAQQQLIMQSLNSALDDHIGKVAKLYGLAVPIRNWNKVFNMRQTTADGGETVKTALRETWHKAGVELLDRAVADMQSSRMISGNDAISKALQATKSAFVVSTLASNISVSIKQAASYPTAGSVLSAAALTKGLADYYAKIKDGVHAQDVWDEIDEHTSQHWIRRQGLSTQELGELVQSKGILNKLNNKLGKASPMNWIQAIDVGTTAALWYACKVDVRRAGYAEGSREYWNKVTELYDKVIEETQPMYDSLHRAEITKGNELVKNIVMFQTQPIQNSGILRESAMELKMAKRRFGKNSEQAREANRKFVKAVASQAASHLTFTAMTLLAQMLLHRMNPWRDKNGEVSVEGVSVKFLEEFAKSYFGAIVPIFGNYGTSIIEAFVSKFNGKSSYDILSDATVDKINGTVDKFLGLTEPSWDNVTDALCEVATYFGIPAENIKKIIMGAKYHIEDIANGDFLKFKAGYNGSSSSSGQAKKYIDLMDSGEKQKAKAMYDKMVSDKKEEIRKNREKEGKIALSDAELDETAKKSVNTSVKSEFRKQFVEAFKNNDEETKAKIRVQMLRSGLWKEKKDKDGKVTKGIVAVIYAQLDEWVKEYRQNQ